MEGWTVIEQSRLYHSDRLSILACIGGMSDGQTDTDQSRLSIALTNQQTYMISGMSEGQTDRH